MQLCLLQIKTAEINALFLEGQCFISLINNSHLQGSSRTANYSWNYVCVYQIRYFTKWLFIEMKRLIKTRLF